MSEYSSKQPVESNGGRQLSSQMDLWVSKYIKWKLFCDLVLCRVSIDKGDEEEEEGQRGRENRRKGREGENRGKECKTKEGESEDMGEKRCRRIR